MIIQHRLGIAEFVYNWKGRLFYREIPDMKVKCIADDRENLTAGKLYEVLGYKVVVMNKIMYRIKDDSGQEYLYDKEEFEVVDRTGDLQNVP